MDIDIQDVKVTSWYLKGFLAISAVSVFLLLVLGILYLAFTLRHRGLAQRSSTWRIYFPLAVFALLVGYVLSTAAFALLLSRRKILSATHLEFASRAFLLLGHLLLYFTMIEILLGTRNSRQRSQAWSLLARIAYGLTTLVFVSYIIVSTIFQIKGKDALGLELELLVLSKVQAMMLRLATAIFALEIVLHSLMLLIFLPVIALFLAKSRHDRGTSSRAVLVGALLIALVYVLMVASGITPAAIVLSARYQYSLKRKLVIGALAALIRLLALSIILLIRYNMNTSIPSVSGTDTYNPEFEPPMSYITPNAAGPYNTTSPNPESGPHVHFDHSDEDKTHPSTNIGSETGSASPVESDPTNEGTSRPPTAIDARTDPDEAKGDNTEKSPSTLSEDKPQQRADAESSQTHVVIVQRVPTAHS
ncbi:hypothetical protein EJ05DRAFT_499164 [Pseudovirgaria hyperparasitica]|uniref:Uncharacterized protein n=1 Tax=Pseudovirgaria hyperparasitica TaxID=470096 RepID=A0A6A6WD38_9PEZI|nr:uncharacterized protein EJ05DRAFT_499164 [Pseudovirgaria hyperparasitica]KAF2759974.1 hypothetical protein EJ05DRAFT_499164 [Pseudovirgaria hyperparasitica]